MERCQSGFVASRRSNERVAKSHPGGRSGSVFCPSVARYMERCQSGRTELTANELSLVRGTVGSNPTLSAKVLNVAIEN